MLNIYTVFLFIGVFLSSGSILWSVGIRNVFYSRDLSEFTGRGGTGSPGYQKLKINRPEKFFQPSVNYGP